jgi:NTP pyrophosphatase (non-canonical NTP hydrolase)
MQEFNKYQMFVAEMKRYPKQYSVMYPALGLCGEAGEIAEKVKKWLRDDMEGGQVMSEERREAILLELGDPLWYIAALAGDLGYTLQDVVDANVSKLTSRKQRGVLKGSGDNR